MSCYVLMDVDNPYCLMGIAILHAILRPVTMIMANVCLNLDVLWDNIDSKQSVFRVSFLVAPVVLLNIAILA